MKRKLRIYAGFTLVFAGGMLFQAMLEGQSVVDAQNRFGPADVKSVPKSFLEGGDRSGKLLKDILAELELHRKTLAHSEILLERMSHSTDSSSKKLDTANGYLKAIRDRKGDTETLRR